MIDEYAPHLMSNEDLIKHIEKCKSFQNQTSRLEAYDALQEEINKTIEFLRDWRDYEYKP